MRLRETGDEEEWRCGVPGGNEVGQREARHVSQSDVQHEQIVGPCRAKKTQGRAAGVHALDRVASLTKYAAGHIANGGLVIHHQDCCGGHLVKMVLAGGVRKPGCVRKLALAITGFDLNGSSTLSSGAAGDRMEATRPTYAVDPRARAEPGGDEAGPAARPRVAGYAGEGAASAGAPARVHQVLSQGG
jgi:hypothetical protein